MPASEKSRLYDGSAMPLYNLPLHQESKPKNTLIPRLLCLLGLAILAALYFFAPWRLATGAISLSDLDFRSTFPFASSNNNLDQTLLDEPPYKAIIAASLRQDDTSWFHNLLPDWQANIYVVDDPTANLTVPQNKGRESSVYLT